MSSVALLVKSKPMKTAKQWVEESNWTPELKELFWQRAGESKIRGKRPNLENVVYGAFPWSDTPEGHGFWKEVANGKRTDIDRVQNTDQEYETLIRRLLLSLKGRELDWEYGDYLDLFTFFKRGYNAGIREMNEKIDEVLKKLEI